MQRKKNYKKTANLLAIGSVFLLLIAVRFYESVFYDPLQTYFKSDYLHVAMPEIQIGKLLFHLFLRYLINTALSLLIIWIAFRKKSFLVFSIYFYVIAFVLLLIAFSIVLTTHFENSYLFGFYIRRFLIQPIFVLLLLPAFYYQLKNTSEYTS